MSVRNTKNVLSCKYPMEILMGCIRASEILPDLHLVHQRQEDCIMVMWKSWTVLDRESTCSRSYLTKILRIMAIFTMRSVIWARFGLRRLTYRLKIRAWLCQTLILSLKKAISFRSKHQSGIMTLYQVWSTMNVNVAFLLIKLIFNRINPSIFW